MDDDILEMYFSDEADETRDISRLRSLVGSVEETFLNYAKDLMYNQNSFAREHAVFLNYTLLKTRLSKSKHASDFGLFLQTEASFFLKVLACSFHAAAIKLNLLPLQKFPSFEKNLAEASAAEDESDAPATSLPPPTLRVYLSDFGPISSLDSLKSSTVGSMVAVRGSVVRVGSIKPMVTSLRFSCTKCGLEISRKCKDGRYDPPGACPSGKCHGRYFVPQRRSASTIDWQRIRIQETATDMACEHGKAVKFDNSTTNPYLGGRRNALSIDCELTQLLVDSCMPGDPVNIVGIVKALPTTVGANGLPPSSIDPGGMMHGSSLYILYIDAVSIENLSHVAAGKHLNREIRLQGGRNSDYIARKYGYSSKQTTASLWKDFAESSRFNDGIKALGDEEGKSLCFSSLAMHPSHESKHSLQDAHLGVSQVIDLEADINEFGSRFDFSEKALDFIVELYTTVKYPFELIVASLCPNILGKYLLKAALVLALFGGSAIFADTKKQNVQKRGDIHCLIVGDPGIGKSRLLRAISLISDRGVYVSGGSTSTTGLTASVVRESSTGDFVLEAGALALADQGLCCVDELDKLSMGEQHSFLEAMEQQTISVAKAGIVCSLPARASVVAAANPKDGKFQTQKTVSENLKIPSPLLSRFDLIFLVRDEVEPGYDIRLTKHLLRMRGDENSNRGMCTPGASVSPCNTNEVVKSASLIERCESFENSSDILPIPLLQTYIRYARSYCEPTLGQEAAGMIKEFYLSLRSRSTGKTTGGGQFDGIPVTTRQLEALIRLAQARCKAELKTEVTAAHVTDILEIYKSCAVFTENSEDALLMATASKKGRKGKTAASLVKPFWNTLHQRAINAKDNMMSKRDALQCAKDVIRDSALIGIVEPDRLLNIVNEEGLILNVGGKWKINSMPP